MIGIFEVMRLDRAFTLVCVFSVIVVVAPVFADDRLEKKKTQALEMITKRIEQIKKNEDCVINAENMDQFKDCKVKIINLLRKTSAKTILKGF